MPIFREPSVTDRLRDVWKKEKGTILGIGTGLGVVGIASRIATMVHDKRIEEQQKVRDQMLMEIQRNQLQNQIITANILDQVANRIKEESNEPKP